MLAYCTKALDTTLDGTDIEVSPPTEWAALSVASEILVQVRVTGFVASGTRTVELRLETSAEGTEWSGLWKNEVVCLVGEDTNAFFSLSQLAPGRYLRFGAQFRSGFADQTSRIEVWLAGRSKARRGPGLRRTAGAHSNVPADAALHGLAGAGTRETGAC